MTRIHRLEDDPLTVKAVIDSMGEGLITVNAEGFITAVNPYTLNALGYTEDELLGKWYSGIIVGFNQHKQPVATLSRPIVRALTTGEPVSEYTYYLRKDGTAIPVFLTVAPILLGGRPSGAIELFRDITADKQLDIAKDEFVSLASHQLRTPASGVRSILSMFLNGDFGDLSSLQKTYLKKANDSNNRQLQIIEDILSAARIDSGKMELTYAITDIIALVQSSIAEQAQQYESKQQTVTFDSPGELTIWADASKLRMVLDNLLSNASKYTPKDGSIFISVKALHKQVEIEIKDTGVGIEEEDMPRLFAKFSRLDNEFSNQVGGSGLGLYLVKHIIELHHGSIRIESTPGVGSSFFLILPSFGGSEG